MLKFKIIPVTPFQQNCTLFWCEETMEAAIFDPSGDIDIIIAAITATKVILTKVLLTHAHIDLATLIKSIRENLFLLGDDVQFIIGHGPMGTFGEEKRTNPYVGEGVC